MPSTEKNLMFAYTRKDALRDGHLIDVSEYAMMMGICCSVAITSNLNRVCSPDQEEKSEKPFIDKIRDQNILGLMVPILMISVMILTSEGGKELPFTYSSEIKLISDLKGNKTTVKVDLCFYCENSIPVITVMLEGED